MTSLTIHLNNPWRWCDGLMIPTILVDNTQTAPPLQWWPSSRRIDTPFGMSYDTHIGCPMTPISDVLWWRRLEDWMHPACGMGQTFLTSPRLSTSSSVDVVIVVGWISSSSGASDTGFTNNPKKTATVLRCWTAFLPGIYHQTTGTVLWLMLMFSLQCG